MPPVSMGEEGGGPSTGRVGPEVAVGSGVDVAGERAGAGGARVAPWGTGGAAGAGYWLGDIVPGAGWVQPVAGEGPKEGSGARLCRTRLHGQLGGQCGCKLQAEPVPGQCLGAPGGCWV